MLAVTTIRAAIILLYIDHSFGQTFPLLYWTALAVNVAFGASTIIANCLICRPIPYRWSPDIVNGTCGDQKALDLYTAILNLVHDVVLVILPIPILWSVRVASTKRLVTICMFGIGIMYGTQNHQLPIVPNREMLIHVSAAESVPLPHTAST